MQWRGDHGAFASSADGYIMLLAPGSPLVQPLLFSTLTFDPAADLAPVSLVGTYPNIIVVPNSSPFQKLEDLIAHAKANPGTRVGARLGSARCRISPANCSSTRQASR
jgi:tripartite-type tricarboxylate transporter receptor subunit TctC